MKKASVFVIISLIILSSCSHKNEAIELSRDFFTALSDSTYGSPTDFYPRYDSLGIEAKSDIVDIEESDITEKNDTLIVRCYNNYTNSEGTFKQDSVTLFITRNEEKQFYIYDSKGLIVMDKDLEWFGTATGAFGKKLPNDQALAKRIEQVRSMMWNKYIEVRAELATKVKISNWSWETSYSGDAHGEGRVINNLDYSISGIKYHVNYYDRFVKQDFEKPTIGILLCESKKEALVELTLPKDSNIYATQYQLYLPDKDLLQAKVREWIAEFKETNGDKE